MANKYLHIIFILAALCCMHTSFAQKLDSVDLLKDAFYYDKELLKSNIHTPKFVTEKDIELFYKSLQNSDTDQLILSLLEYQKDHQLSDWLYYQLVRHISNSVSPKADNYHRYTLYKWYLMNKSGFDARLALGDNQIIFYIRNKEDIRDIPYFTIDNNQYTCLNVHDYGKLFRKEGTYTPVYIFFPESHKEFSYKVSNMPELNEEAYFTKKIDFRYNDKVYNFHIKVNEEINSIFKNYPGVDFKSYFNIPLTKTTYQSLIPVLKDHIKDLCTENGVDYLMRFTRYAFLYEDDEFNFGKEVRLSPGQTLINEYSDCDDRAALFFYLVKEIYNLPMVAVLFPTHITMAVEFEKPIGESIFYAGKQYTICEPTPQGINLGIGELTEKNRNESYKIVYHYQPN